MLRVLCIVSALGLARAVAAGGPLRLVPLGPLQAWSRAEFRVEGAPAADNNFDPDQITIDAVVTAPSGHRLTVPAFWYQDYRRERTKDGEDLTPVGAPEWRLRVMPEEAGDYAVEFRVALAGGPPTATVAAFTVAGGMPAGQHGWVGLGPDRRYFRTSDGRPLRLVGENTCWADRHGTYDFDAWFDAMRRSGQNCARLWMAPWWAGLEQQPGSLTRYRQDGAWQLDHVFDAAEANGIYLILCCDFHGMFQTDNPAWGGTSNKWVDNPYNAANGGPCKGQNDFFTDPAARRIYEKRLRYLIARYGPSTHLLAWQFFNEIDNVFPPRPLRGPDVVRWHQDTARWIKAHDPFGHLVTTSLTGGSDRPEFWQLPEMDFAVFHSYDEAAPARRHAELAHDFLRRYGKPVLIGEFGVNSLGWARAADPALRGLRQALWGGALGGSAGTPLPWWWQSIHEENAYPVYTALTAILDRAGWRDGAWRPADTAPAEAVPPTELGEPDPGAPEFSGELVLSPQRRRPLPGRAPITGPFAAARAFESLSAFVLGTGLGDLRQSLSIDAWWGENARVRVHFAMADGSPDIVAAVDDARVGRVSLSASPGAGRRPVDRALEFAVPAGRHRVSLANVASLWAMIDHFEVRGLRPTAEDARSAAGATLEAVALRQDDRALVYAMSPWMVYPAGARQTTGPVQRDRRVVLSGWPAGAYRVEWYDPATAKPLGAAHGLVSTGALVLPLPPFAEDIAGIVRRDDPAPAAGK